MKPDSHLAGETQLADSSSQGASACDQPDDIDVLMSALVASDQHLIECIKALRFYARGHHFIVNDEMAWDTVSGEPQNYQCDEAGTATVEDGTIAAMTLRGNYLKCDEADDGPAPLDDELNIANFKVITRASQNADNPTQGHVESTPQRSNEELESLLTAANEKIARLERDNLKFEAAIAEDHLKIECLERALAGEATEEMTITTTAGVMVSLDRYNELIRIENENKS